jgi:sulfur dioxygenase
MSSSSEALPHPFVRPPRRGAVPLVGPKELAGLLASDDPPLLVDVRPERERRIARLPGDRGIPLEQLGDALPSLDRERAIVTYDHLGFRAREAAEFLLAHGYPRVAALEGGVDEYARLVDPGLARYLPDFVSQGLWLRQVPRPDTGCLSYLVGDPQERTAVIVDPGFDPAPYFVLLREGDWKLVGIVETHTHADHLAGHARLHTATGAPIYTGHRAPAAYPHHPLAEGDVVPFGGEHLSVLETPGHTRDHLTLRLRDKVFTGDTLLLGSCGRTDLGDGSPEQLYESLTEKLLRLPGETEVYPAHYGPHHALPDRYVSTLGFERLTNEALTQASPEAFVRYMTVGWPPKPTDFDRIVAANLAE